MKAFILAAAAVCACAPAVPAPDRTVIGRVINVYDAQRRTEYESSGRHVLLQAGEARYNVVGPEANTMLAGDSVRIVARWYSFDNGLTEPYEWHIVEVRFLRRTT